MKSLEGFLIFLLLFLIFELAFGAERDQSQVRAFRKDNPCPATQKTSGACNGWVVDHVIPLALCGPDRPDNMQWQKYQASKIKDKLEMEAYYSFKKGGGKCEPTIKMKGLKTE